MNRLLTVLFVIACLHLGWKYVARSGESFASAEMSAADMSALAATVAAEDVVMYSATECPHCAEAKAWLSRYGFAFTECNMSVERRCEREFRKHGGTGTPYLVVRGHHMKDGFDSDEFLGALKR